MTDRDIARVVTGAPGRRVVWRVKGEGPALVLLHGGYGSWTHWHRNIDALAQSVRVLAPDMPGFGESDDPEDPASLGSIAAPLLEGIDALAGPHAALDLAAFSFGGSVAAALVRPLGPRLRSLILVGAGGLRLPRPAPVALRAWRHLSDPEAVRDAHRHNLAAFMFADPGVIDERTIAIQAQNTLRSRINSQALSRHGLLHDELPRFRGRLLGIWGDRDAAAAGHLDARADFLRAANPAARFETVRGAGHWVQAERPDTVNALIGDFLAASASKFPSEPERTDARADTVPLS